LSKSLKKYKHLFLITADYADYPLLLHDRIRVESIDTKKELLVLAYYEFNDDSFNRLFDEFKQIPQDKLGQREIISCPF
jgi:hypothetical protein